MSATTFASAATGLSFGQEVFDKIRQRFNWLELVWADGGYNAHQVTDAAAKVPILR